MKFGKLGKIISRGKQIISGLEFDKGAAKFVGILGGIGSLIFAVINSAKNLSDDNSEPVENPDECDLLKSNQQEEEVTETEVTEVTEEETPAEPEEA